MIYQLWMCSGFPTLPPHYRRNDRRGSLVTVRGRIIGEHLGPLMNIEPTGKAVDFSIFITYRIADGKISDHWMLTDNMTMMQQIGAVANAV